MAFMKSQRARRGTMVVEAALLFPLLILLTFGMMEYGWVLLKSEQLSNAARQGVRLAAVKNATSATVNSQITSLMTVANITGAQITISPGVNAAPGSTVTVQISIPYKNSGNQLVGIPLLVPTPTNLQASVSMMKEG